MSKDETRKITNYCPCDYKCVKHKRCVWKHLCAIKPEKMDKEAANHEKS